MTVDGQSRAWVWPAAPKLTTPSERDVWDRLVQQLPAGSFLIGNLRLSDINKNHEIDALVLLPGRGALVLEVKGSGIAWSPEQGWTSMRGNVTQPSDPVEQARAAMYAVRNLVEHDPRWGTRDRIRWAHAVVTPFTAFGPDFGLTDLPRWMLHDRDDQAQLVERLALQLDQTQHRGAHDPSGDHLEVIADILTRPRGMAQDVLAESE